jgi:hypothetical protein
MYMSPQNNSVQNNDFQNPIGFNSVAQQTTSSSGGQAVATSNFDQELEEQKQQEELLNQELGLYIPQGVLTETIPLWQSLFYELRYLYKNELATKENIQEYVTRFGSLPDNKKNQCLVMMRDAIRAKESENELLEEIRVDEEIKEETDALIRMLGPEMKEKVLYFIASGQDLPPEIVSQMKDDLHDMDDDQVLERLSRAMDRRRTLNGIGEPGQVLNPEEIVDRFNLDDTDAVQSNSIAEQVSIIPNQTPQIAQAPQRLQPIPARPPIRPNTPRPNGAQPFNQPMNTIQTPPPQRPINSAINQYPTQNSLPPQFNPERPQTQVVNSPNPNYYTPPGVHNKPNGLDKLL